VVAIDDHSSDNTFEILQKYSNILNMLIIKNEKRIGFYRNFEASIRRCSGLYIALCDHDDIWFDNKIEKLVNGINGYSLVHSDAVLINDNDTIIHESYLNYSGVYVHDSLFPRLLFHPSVLGCTCLFTRELADKSFPFPEGEVYHDWWLSIVASKSDGIKYLNDKLIMYRQHNLNHTGAPKHIPLYKLLFRCFSRQSQSEKNRYSLMMRARLGGLRNHHIFNNNDKNIIDDAINYYSYRIDRVFHPRCVPIAIKYRNDIFATYNKKYRYILAIATFF
jgi:glycosyltransferase involved in cell wall biosynthesis